MKRYFIILLILISFTSCIQGNTPLLEKIYSFPKGQYGYASLNNKDGSLFITYSKSSNEKGVYWYQKNKESKKIIDANYGSVSPNGEYYTFINEAKNSLYIYKNSGQLIKTFEVKGVFSSPVWSYDSQNLYICENGDITRIYRYNLLTNIKEEVIHSERLYFKPVTIIDNNVIYMLKSKSPKDTDSDCDIIRFNIKEKSINKISLPTINNLYIFESYTVSPNGKILIFENSNDGIIYIVDMLQCKIIDKILTPSNSSPGEYSWKNDSSYFIFTITRREILKYTIPTTTSSPVEQKNPLTSEYAKKYYQFPGGEKLSEKEQQEQITIANSLSDEGFNYYKAKKDDLAIAKYEDALKHYASAEIYYRYGNSLSNISRLEDAVKAYQIAIELNYDKLGLVYYNIACAYSRLNKSKEAFANLEQAINNGYKNFDHIQKDEDLVWLRSQPEWKDWWAKHQK